MKHFFKFLFVAFISVFVIACTQSAQKEESHQAEIHEESHDHAEEMDVLTLDSNGNKWLANAETTMGVNAMIALVDATTETENTEAYKMLKSNLQTEFNTIIEKCTMTGESHNQLHVFLMPMKDIFTALESTDLEAQKAAYSELKTHLAAYTNYFE